MTDHLKLSEEQFLGYDCTESQIEMSMDVTSIISSDICHAYIVRYITHCIYIKMNIINILADHAASVISSALCVRGGAQAKRRCYSRRYLVISKSSYELHGHDFFSYFAKKLKIRDMSVYTGHRRIKMFLFSRGLTIVFLTVCGKIPCWRD